MKSLLNMPALLLVGEALLFPVFAAMVIAFPNGIGPDSNEASFLGTWVWVGAFLLTATCSALVALALLGGVSRTTRAGVLLVSMSSLVVILSHLTVATFFVKGIALREFDSWGTLEIAWILVPAWVACSAARLLVSSNGLRTA